MKQFGDLKSGDRVWYMYVDVYGERVVIQEGETRIYYTETVNPNLLQFYTEAVEGFSLTNVFAYNGEEEYSFCLVKFVPTIPELLWLGKKIKDEVECESFVFMFFNNQIEELFRYKFWEYKEKDRQVRLLRSMTNLTKPSNIKRFSENARRFFLLEWMTKY